MRATGAALLLALHILFLRIAWVALGADGIVASLAIIVAGLLALHELGVLDLWRSDVQTYLLLGTFSLILAIGMAWSLLKRRIVEWRIRPTRSRAFAHSSQQELKSGLSLRHCSPRYVS